MKSHKGFIVLVDISGYTNFVSKHNITSSKDHKDEKVSELINIIDVHLNAY